MTAKTIRLAYLFVVAVALVVLFFVPWMTVLGHPSPQACGASPPEGPAHPWLENQFAAVALSLGGLLVGSIASYVGKVKQLSQITWLRGLFMGGGRNVRRAEGSVQIGLLLLLLLAHYMKLAASIPLSRSAGGRACHWRGLMLAI